MAPLLAHAACLCLALTGAVAEPPRPIKDVIADLGSSSFAVREGASDELASSKHYSLAAIEEALKDKALTCEQRLRLERAGFSAFREMPHGALGVEFTPATNVAEIADVKKHFPSAATLKAGDIITQIDGEPITSRLSEDGRVSTVRALVISHMPGDEVPVVVLRKGQPVNLVVKFGDFNDLGRDPANPAFNRPGMLVTMNAITEAECAAAWKFRLKRTTGQTDPAPIDATGLRPRHDAQWSAHAPVDAIDESNRARAANGDAPPVVAGASPDLERQLDAARQLDGGFSPRRSGFGRLNPGVNNLPFGGANVQDYSLWDDTQLAVKRAQLNQSRAAYMQIADQAGLPPDAKQQFRMMEEELRNQVARIDAEFARRKAAKINAKPVPLAPVAPVAPDVAPDQKADKP